MVLLVRILCPLKRSTKVHRCSPPVDGAGQRVLLHLLWADPTSQTGVMRTRRVRPDPIPRSAFAGFCFPPDVIVLAVRWYLRFGLSYRDVEELLAERGIEVDHVTVYRWVVRFTPLLADAARPCRHSVGDRWQADETSRHGAICRRPVDSSRGPSARPRPCRARS
jgi:hypothetical protein